VFVHIAIGLGKRQVGLNLIMKPKEEISESALSQMLLAEIRKRPDWAHIRAVVILPLGRTSRHQPNWQASTVVRGAGLGRLLELDLIIADLQGRYDLA
jgi:hypothetical protein